MHSSSANWNRLADKVVAAAAERNAASVRLVEDVLDEFLAFFQPGPISQTRTSSVLNRFQQSPLSSTEFSPSFTGFHGIILGFIGFYWLSTGCLLVVWFCWVLQDFTGFYWVSLGFT